ncbi:unnamed protein product, partial [Cladocopium goreaui]
PFFSPGMGSSPSCITECGGSDCRPLVQRLMREPEDKETISMHRYEHAESTATPDTTVESTWGSQMPPLPPVMPGLVLHDGFLEEISGFIRDLVRGRTLPVLAVNGTAVECLVAMDKQLRYMVIQRTGKKEAKRRALALETVDQETSMPGGMQWPRSALPSAEETDEEVVWNGAPAQQDLLMTESEDDSEVALLQMLGISSDLDDEFVDSDGESEADQQALQMKTRESTEKERRMEEWLQQLCHEVDKLQATSSWLTVGLQQALGAVDNLELCLQQQIQLTEQLQELHRMQLEAGFSHADTEYERTEETWADFASISAPWNPSTELCGQKAPPDLEMTSGLWKSISFSTGLPGMTKTHIKGPPEHLDVTSGQAMSAACRRRVRCHSAVPLLVAPRRWEMLRLRIDGAREILISRLQQFLAGIDAWLLQSPLSMATSMPTVPV